MANTHALPSMQDELGAHFRELVTGYVHSGGLPVVPGASLTLGAFATTGYVVDSGVLRYVSQSSRAVGPLNAGNGTYWVALHADTNTTVASWTRQTGTHYLWRLSAPMPATPASALLLAKVTVAAGAITVVADYRKPASYVRQGVLDPEDALYGGVADCDGTTGTDSSAAWSAVLAAAKQLGFPVEFGGWWRLNTMQTVLLATYDQGMTIRGRHMDGTPNLATMIPGADSRLFFGSATASDSCLRFEQSPFAIGGSFTPVSLRDFAVHALVAQKGVACGMRGYGIPFDAENVGAFELNIGFDGEDQNGTKMYGCSAQYNKAIGCRLRGVSEGLITACRFMSTSTQQHGAGAPYTGTNLVMDVSPSGTTTGFTRVIRTHLSSAPVGLSMDGTADCTIDEPYFEANDNGAGTLRAWQIGHTTNNINPRIINPHQQGSVLGSIDRCVGGRIECQAPPLRTANTVNVDIFSSIHPSLAPHFPVGVPEFAKGNTLVHHNMVRDGFLIHGPALNQHTTLVTGGTGTKTLAYITSPPGLAPGRAYRRLRAVGGTGEFSEPLTVGGHSLHTGVLLYVALYYYTADTPSATFVVTLTGVDAAGAPVSAVSSSTGQLTGTSWGTALVTIPIANTAGFDTVTGGNLVFTLADPGDLLIGSMYVGIRPDMESFNPSDGDFSFRVSATAAAPHVIPAMTMASYVFQVTGEDPAVNWAAAEVAGTIEIRTNSVGAASATVTAKPQQTRGY